MKGKMVEGGSWVYWEVLNGNIPLYCEQTPALPKKLLDVFEEMTQNMFCHNLHYNKVTLCQCPSRLFSLTEHFTTGWWLVLLAERTKTQQTEVCVSQSWAEVERRMISMPWLWKKGIIWEWRARRLGCFLVGRRNVGAGGYRCACFYVHVCIRPRQESFTPTDSGSTYQDLNKEGEGGGGLGILRYQIHLLPPITAFLPFSAAHTHSHRERHTLDLDAAYLWG